MIPKTIHYCWFGRNPKPKLAKKCIKSWKRKCRGYEIIEWNEDNFDIQSAPLYVRQAYEAKKWAFVTDYVRLKVVYDYGGLYFDTDVELIKKVDSLLTCCAFFGFEDGQHIATGLGFGAEKGLPLLSELLNDYDRISFYLPDGSINSVTCPVLNTRVFLRHGLKQDDSYQVLDGGVHILPSRVLCPIDYNTGIKTVCGDTVSIHWFEASWQSAEIRDKHKKEVQAIHRNERRHCFQHLPNLIAIKVLGQRRYDTIKSKIKDRW